ncbi:MAG: hypothetical protein IIC03_03500 [Proteobacteria bacterium]|nr:hypothetical protein [Pseudomonadota bacterium]
MTYEYKIIGAPEKGKRKRGMRRKSDRVAAAFADILKSEAVDGWEYQRTDLLPVIEGAGWFRRGHEVHRAVMVFRRARNRARVESDATLRRAPSVVAPAAPPVAPGRTAGGSRRAANARAGATGGARGQRRPRSAARRLRPGAGPTPAGGLIPAIAGATR